MAAPPFVLGITGNIGSGKSTVASLWAEHGCRIIEGDELGKRIITESAPYRAWLAERFGADLFDSGKLDRAELGRRAFRDQQSRDDLNAMSWRYIRDLLQQEIDSALQDGLIALVDAAMIFEWKDQARYDVLVAVVVDPETGARRAAERMGHTVDEMMARYRMQVPVDDKAAGSDIVIRNDAGLPELRARAAEVWPEVRERGQSRALQRNSTDPPPRT